MDKERIAQDNFICFTFILFQELSHLYPCAMPIKSSIRVSHIPWFLFSIVHVHVAFSNPPIRLSLNNFDALCRFQFNQQIHRKRGTVAKEFARIIYIPKGFSRIMKDHFVLLVDRLLTESSLEAVIESENTLLNHTDSVNEEIVTDVSSHRMDLNFESKTKKLVECRICHDEDEDSNMETPCACRGSLKFAHRRCVQRWCNEKGNTTCEICLQPFKPGYTSPPPLLHCDGSPINFRGNWEIPRRDLYNLQLSTMVSSGHEDPDFDDYIAPSPGSLTCCRVVAIIFMTLLVLRHTLPIFINGTGGYTITMFTLIMLRCIGVMLPIYIMFRAFTVVQRGLQLEDHRYFHSDEENDLPQSSTDVRLVHVH